MAGCKVLFVTGCPDVPVQISIVLYFSNRLLKHGHEVTVAGTDAALKLLSISDPEGHYIENTIGLDQCIADLVEKRKEFGYCFVFMHNDAGMTYGASISVISKARLYAVIFGKNTESIAYTIEYPAEKIVAKAVHNPTPLRNKLNKVII